MKRIKEGVDEGGSVNASMGVCEIVMTVDYGTS